MNNSNFKILIVDDELSIRKKCVKILQKQGYYVNEADNGITAQSMIKKNDLHLIIADIKMPGLDGIELLQWIKGFNPNLDLIIITGYGTVENAVKAIKIGAYDYITKPFDMDKLLKTVENVAEKHELTEKVCSLKKKIREISSEDQDDIIGISAQMQDVFKLVNKMSLIDCNVLLQGESGVGKGMIAKAIHQNSSRNNNNFIVVDCAALKESLTESELFGYRKGAFTGANNKKQGFFEVADKGTILLDEIGELSLTLQGKLLRVTQEHEIVPLGDTKPIKIDTRIIAATNKDLESLVQKGQFREDLYYRLNVAKIEIPPLRSRLDDITPLSYYLFDKTKKKFKKTNLVLTDSVVQQLNQYYWPGNIRELENTIIHMVISAENNTVDLNDLPKKIINANGTYNFEAQEFIDTDFMQARKKYLDDFSKKFIIEALRRNQGNITKTARAINLRRPSLQRMIKRYNIETKEFSTGL